MGLKYPAAATANLMSEPPSFVAGNLLAVNATGDASDLGYTADQLSSSVISKAAAGLTQMGQWSASTALATTGETLGATPTTEPIGGYYETTTAGTKFGITFIVGDRLLVAQTPAGAKVWSKQQALGDIFDASSVYAASSTGADTQSGTLLRPKKTLSAAISVVAQPGTIDLAPGAYGTAGQSFSVTKQNIFVLGKGANGSNQVTLSESLTLDAARFRLRDVNLAGTVTWADTTGGHQMLGVGGLSGFAFIGASTARGFAILSDSDFGSSTATSTVQLADLPAGKSATLYITRVTGVRASIGAGWIVYVTDCKDFICTGLSATATLLRTDDLQFISRLTTQAELDAAKADLTAASVGYYILDFASPTGIADVVKGDVIFKTISIASGAPVAQMGLHAKYAYAPPVMYGQGKSYYKSGSNAWGEVGSGSGSSGTINFSRLVRYTQQTPIAVNTSVLFAVEEYKNGSGISLNSSTGQITLAAGQAYDLEGSIGSLTSSGTAARLQYQWYNETTSAWIGQPVSLYAPAETAVNAVAGGFAKAVVNANVQTVVSLRITSATNVSSIGSNGDFSNFHGSWANIQALTGAPATSSIVTYGGPVVFDTTGATKPTKPNATTRDYLSVVDDGSGFCSLTMDFAWEVATGAAPGVGIYLVRLAAGAPSFDLNYHKPVTGTLTGLANFIEVGRAIPGSYGLISRSDSIARVMVAYAYDATHFIMTPEVRYAEYQKVRSDYFQITSGFVNQSYSMSFRYKKA